MENSTLLVGKSSVSCAPKNTSKSLSKEQRKLLERKYLFEVHFATMQELHECAIESVSRKVAIHARNGKIETFADEGKRVVVNAQGDFPGSKNTIVSPKFLVAAMSDSQLDELKAEIAKREALQEMIEPPEEVLGEIPEDEDEDEDWDAA